MTEKTYKPVCKIDDPRIKDYVNRTRSGSTQVFYTGSDSRDFDRYRAEEGHRKPDIEMHDKSDTINIVPPEKHYYAELIDGEWWWLNGCDQCNGRESAWCDSVCVEHDVCRTCAKSSDEVTGTRWGTRKGWQCDPCQISEHEAEKSSALAAMPEEYDNWRFHGVDEITCPYCANEFTDSFESAGDDNENHECGRCDAIFTVTAVHSLTFDCDRID